MSTTCEYCSSPLIFTSLGEVCSNEKCSYIDGHYSGPREPLPKNSVTFEQLRVANAERTTHFKNNLGELSDCSDWTLSDWMTAFAGEAGEACDEAKKIRRGDYKNDPALGKANLLKELADTVVYADHVARYLGFPLGIAIREKFNEVSNRIGSNVKIP